MSRRTAVVLCILSLTISLAIIIREMCVNPLFASSVLAVLVFVSLFFGVFGLIALFSRR